MQIDEALRVAVNSLTEHARTETIEAFVESVDEENMTAVVRPKVFNANFCKVRLKASQSDYTGDEKIPTVGSTVLVSLVHGNDREPFVSKYTSLSKSRQNVGDYEICLEKKEGENAKEVISINKRITPEDEGSVDVNGNDILQEIKIEDNEITIRNTKEEGENRVDKHFIKLNDEGVSIQVGEQTIEITENEIKLNGGDLGGLIKIEALVERINLLEDALKNHQHTYINAGGTPTPTTGDLPDPNLLFNNLQKSQIENTKITHG